jgi:branched-chain amino acid transport system substrate-binding protein
MTISWRGAIAGVGVAGLVLGLSACGGSSGGSSGGGSSNSTYTFGVLNSLTGDLGAVGQQERKGIDLAVKQINDSGGIDGHKLAVDYFDDQGSVNQTTAGFKQLAGKKYPVILGPGITASSQAVAPLADQYGVTEILFVAQPATANGTKNVFETAPPQDAASQAMVDYASKAGAKTAALITATNPYGQNGNTGVSNAAKAAGMKIVSNDTWDPSKFDFTAQASKVAGLNPDVVFLYGAGGTSDALLLKAVRAAGYKGKVVGDLSYSTSTVPQAAGPAADTIVAFSPIDFGNPQGATKAFIDAYKAAYNENPTALSAYGYAGVEVAAAGIKKVGKADGNAIAKTIQGLNYESVVGTLAWTDKDHGGPQGAGTYKPVSFKNGDYAPPYF